MNYFVNMLSIQNTNQSVNPCEFLNICEKCSQDIEFAIFTYILPYERYFLSLSSSKYIPYQLEIDIPFLNIFESPWPLAVPLGNEFVPVIWPVQLLSLSTIPFSLSSDVILLSSGLSTSSNSLFSCKINHPYLT